MAELIRKTDFGFIFCQQLSTSIMAVLKNRRIWSESKLLYLDIGLQYMMGKNYTRNSDAGQNFDLLHIFFFFVVCVLLPWPIGITYIQLLHFDGVQRYENTCCWSMKMFSRRHRKWRYDEWKRFITTRRQGDGSTNETCAVSLSLLYETRLLSITMKTRLACISSTHTHAHTHNYHYT